MSCCDTEKTIAAQGSCARCESKGVQVAVTTVKALLTGDGLRRGVPQAPRFCATPSCPTVYFDDVSDRRVTENELTVRVYAKHPDDVDVLVCYCFGYTSGSIRQGQSQTSEDVRAQVETGHCACEVKNPRGACCLGDIMKLERA